MEVPFQVPADLLQAHPHPARHRHSGHRRRCAQAEEETTYELNADLKESRIGTAFFSPIAGGHRLEVRGRNGEPLASRALTLTCHRHDYRCDVKVGSAATRRAASISANSTPSTTLKSAAQTSPRPFMSPQTERARLRLEPPSPAGPTSACRSKNPLPRRTASSSRCWKHVDGQLVRDHFDKTRHRGRPTRHPRPAARRFQTHPRRRNHRHPDFLRHPDTDGLLVSETRILPRHAPPSRTSPAPSRRTTNSTSSSAISARTPAFPSSASATATRSGMPAPVSIPSIRPCPTASRPASSATAI